MSQVPSNASLQSINTVLGRPATQAFDMNDYEARLLSKVDTNPGTPWYLSSAAGKSAWAKTLGVGSFNNQYGYLSLNYGSISDAFFGWFNGRITEMNCQDIAPGNLDTKLFIEDMNVGSIGQFDAFRVIRFKSGSFSGPVIRELYPGNANSFLSTSNRASWVWNDLGPWMAPYAGQNIFMTIFEA